MRERPILFSAPMVRAILDGRKAQTRRVMKHQPQRVVVHDIGPMLAIQQPRGNRRWLWPNARAEVIAACPYGQPGDRLWVRETFAAWWDTATGKRSHVMGYRADINDPEWDGFGADDPWWLDAKWEPSIHMPRAFSRIQLEITDVRIERLQAISESDAAAEGVHRIQIGSGYPDLFSAFPTSWAEVIEQQADAHEDARLAYRDLWESINGPGSWSINPWVWVVEFKRVTANG